jgi:hypothetical protein
MKQPLDPETYLRARDALTRAVRLGLDPVELLHNDGLLLTAHRDKIIRMQAMQFLYNEVTKFAPHEYLRRRFTSTDNRTPQDLYNCLVGFLEEQLVWFEETQ